MRLDLRYGENWSFALDLQNSLEDARSDLQAIWTVLSRSPGSGFVRRI